MSRKSYETANIIICMFYPSRFIAKSDVNIGKITKPKRIFTQKMSQAGRLDIYIVMYHDITANTAGAN